MTTFSDLGLIDPLLRAVEADGYTNPTPIQIQAIPEVLAARDLLGLAQTGTGKTAAFALPILQRLASTESASPDAQRPPRRRIRALILTPTRELASQIGESFASYGRHLRFRHTVIFGGVSKLHQARDLRAGVDIVIATPGRLLDLSHDGLLHFEHLEILVLDEADRMLDMGFVHDVKRIIHMLPKKKQTLFFSATMPREAQYLADSLLQNPATVAVTPVSSTAERVQQSVWFVQKSEKRARLIELLQNPEVRRALVFARTKMGANRVTLSLQHAGIEAEVIHGNKSQAARERALAVFKEGRCRVLVATDIAARGIDVDDISHVINFEMPNLPETYVHRIGRTARAGNTGLAVGFCDPEEHPYLDDIERLIQQKVPVHPLSPPDPRLARGPRKPSIIYRSPRPRGGGASMSRR
jgi:ATP-dependent RNA helicase RhlE